MSDWNWRWSGLFAVCLLAAGWAGCGKSADDGSQASNEEAGKLPTAAIGSSSEEEEDDDMDNAADDDKTPIVEPKQGTPEWLVREATRLRLEPPPKTEDVEELKADRKQKNQKIVSLCQEAISSVHDKEDKARVFIMAVRQMMEARLQLALLGDRENIDSLYEDAAALFERDPKSPAAAEGAHALVQLAYSHAKGSNGENVQWLEEFARQARHFAENFPADERRSLPLLFTAARSCDMQGNTEEALECYSLLQSNFGKTQYGLHAAPPMRRLKLVGNPPQIAGPTLTGDQITLDDLLGKPVLIVFWSSAAKPFEEQLPAVLKTTRSFAKQGLTVIGVSLDTDATALNQYIVSHKIPWPQIYFQEKDKQGWNHPVVGYYGLLRIPAYWLVDQSGNVTAMTESVEKMQEELATLLSGAAPVVKPKDTTKAKDVEPEADASVLERPRKAIKRPSREEEE